MKSSEDRRAPEVRRVPITTLVDICTQTGSVSPFQGESADLSGRGMSVTTSYLPEVGEELVCRFHQDDQEILVEGRVAWRSEGHDSGEFGIQFTALDADSAHVLQSLGQSEAAPPNSSLTPVIHAEVEDHLDAALLTGGERVKLHIEGLGAPMKACVHEGSSRKLRVGSSLEFLKVGRSLEIEDMNAGERRGAHVDMVNVVINPATSVPELVVQLRYDGVTPTPAPAKTAIDYDDAAFGPRSASFKDRSARDDEMEEGELSDDDPAPWQPAADALRLRLGGAMASAGQAAQKASGIASAVAQTARASVSSAVAKRGGVNASSTHLGSQQSVGLRRRQTTRATARTAPSYLRSGIHEAGLAGKHRPVGETRRVERTKAVLAPKRKARAATIFAAAFVVFGVSAYGFRTWGEEGATGASPVLSAEKKAEGTATQDEAPKSAAKSPAAAEKKSAPGGIVAEVPLFGPQAMNEKPAAPELSPDDEVEAEKRAAAAMVPDESWEEKPQETAASDQKPWGNGRLYLPTIHRIRLDAPATSFTGSVSDDGFSVVIPGKKAMESGKAIQKRDKRIASVHSGNDPRGATVKFEFRGPVPAYRVRLRKDFVEFLISAPEETVARL